MLDGLAPAESEASDGLLRQMRREKQQLEEELLAVRRELDDANREKDRLERTLRNLRQQLSPLHRALRAVFGEIELGIGEETFSTASPSSAPQTSGSVDPRWQSWKEKLPGRPAEMIGMLLLHQQMSTKQLMAAMHCGKDAVYAAAYKLSQAGLVSQNGGRYSLKSL